MPQNPLTILQAIQYLQQVETQAKAIKEDMCDVEDAAHQAILDLIGDTTKDFVQLNLPPAKADVVTTHNATADTQGNDDTIMDNLNTLEAGLPATA